jgi:hypothetical protein
MTPPLFLLSSTPPGVKRGGCSAIQGSSLPASAYALARKGCSRRGLRTVPRAPKAAHLATTATRPASSLEQGKASSGGRRIEHDAYSSFVSAWLFFCYPNENLRHASRLS